MSIELQILPEIKRNINITLEDLLKSFNNSWSLEDRLALIMGLKLEGEEQTKGVSAIASVVSGLDINDLTVEQLMILDSAFKDFKSKIDSKKEEFIKSKDE